MYIEKVVSLDQVMRDVSMNVANLKAEAAVAAKGLDRKKRQGRPKKKNLPMSATEAHNKVEIFLNEICTSCIPEDLSERTTTDLTLNSLIYKHLPALCCVLASLSANMKDKKINLIFCRYIVKMVELLNLFLDPQLLLL